MAELRQFLNKEFSELAARAQTTYEGVSRGEGRGNVCVCLLSLLSLFCSLWLLCLCCVLFTKPEVTVVCVSMCPYDSKTRARFIPLVFSFLCLSLSLRLFFCLQRCFVINLHVQLKGASRKRLCVVLNASLCMEGLMKNPLAAIEMCTAAIESAEVRSVTHCHLFLVAIFSVLFA